MKTRRSTQHLLAATIAASALALTGCSGSAPETRTDVIDPVVQADPTTPSAPASTATDAPTAPLTTVPDDFPIDATTGDQPTSDGEITVHGPARDEEGVDSLTKCGIDLPLPGQGTHAASEVLGYAVTGPEYYIGRTLQAFPNADAAHDRFTELRSDIEDCSTDTDDNGNTRHWRVFDADTGYESVTFGYTYGPHNAPAGELFTVVRVGTALLGLRSYAEFSPDSIERYGVPASIDTVGLIGPEMCVFTEAGCDGGSDVATTLPDDVPLDDGLYDMRGDGGHFVKASHPDRTPHWLTLELCGRTLWPVDHTDELLAYATGPEYSDTRDLVTLGSVDEAEQTVAAIRTALQDCHGEDNSVWTEQRADTGFDSVTFTLSSSDGLGLSIYQVTRVGNEVLFTVGYGEGSIESAGRTVHQRTDLTHFLASHL